MLQTLTRKLLLAGGGLLISVALAAAFIITNVLLIRAAVDHLTNHTVEQLKLTGQFNTDIFRSIVDVESFVRDHDPVERAEALQELQDARTILDQLNGGLTSNEAQGQDLDTAQANLQRQRVVVFATVESKVLNVLQAAERNDTTAIARALADLTEIERNVEAIEEHSADLADQSMHAAIATMNTVIQRAIVVTLGLFGLFALAVQLLLLFMRQTIVRPIMQLSAVARTVADGELDHTIAITSHDEIGSLQASFNHMVNNLRMAEATTTDYQRTLEARVAARTTELESERATLAQRVAERTADLSAANTELEHAARHKDEFLASMSHELRTPLNTILGMTETLQEGVFGAINAQQSDSLRHIDESGRHLLVLINDILDLSKVESGKLELHVEEVELVVVAQASLRLISQLARQKDLRIVASLDSTVGLLQADARRLKQMLVNLLSNAIKFTPEGGAVGLDVVGDATAHLVHMTIWDTGIGMAADDLPRLFQPFVQLDSRLARQYNGTGLGLALVQRMAALQGGSVAVESTLGQGSRFTITLPWTAAVPESDSASESESTALPGAPDPSLAPRSSIILLAEDDENNIRILTPYLAAKGYQVVVARNGAEALERAHASRPALILMDIQMPGMDGLEAIRRIRATPWLAAIPIIALTALAMAGDRERCLAAGADDYLSKPVSLRALVAAIDTHLHHPAAEPKIINETP